MRKKTSASALQEPVGVETSRDTTPVQCDHTVDGDHIVQRPPVQNVPTNGRPVGKCLSMAATTVNTSKFVFLASSWKKVQLCSCQCVSSAPVEKLLSFKNSLS